MRENDIRQVLRRLAIPANSRANSKGWIAFPCPVAPWFHKSGKDNNPSAAVKIEDNGKSFWACQACKQKGSLSDLAYQLSRLRNQPLDQSLAKQLEESDFFIDTTMQFENFRAVEVRPTPLDEDLVDGAYPDAWEIPEAREYLQSRGINQAGAEALGLVYLEHDFIGERQRFERRILFPVRDRTGAIFGFSGRSIDPNVQPKIRDYHYDKRFMVLGEHRWRQGWPKLIVEGLFGYGHLVQIGAEEICDVGAVLGSNLTPEKEALLKMWSDKTYLLPDNDEAGDLFLFGRREEDGSHAYEEGAIARLMDHMPVMVPAWPTRDDGTQKNDPDQLTLADVEQMMTTAPFIARGDFSRRLREKRRPKA